MDPLHLRTARGGRRRNSTSELNRAAGGTRHRRVLTLGLALVLAGALLTPPAALAQDPPPCEGCDVNLIVNGDAEAPEAPGEAPPGWTGRVFDEEDPVPCDRCGGQVVATGMTQGYAPGDLDGAREENPDPGLRYLTAFIDPGQDEIRQAYLEQEVDLQDFAALIDSGDADYMWSAFAGTTDQGATPDDPDPTSIDIEIEFYAGPGRTDLLGTVGPGASTGGTELSETTLNFATAQVGIPPETRLLVLEVVFSGRHSDFLLDDVCLVVNAGDSDLLDPGDPRCDTDDAPPPSDDGCGGSTAAGDAAAPKIPEADAGIDSVIADLRGLVVLCHAFAQSGGAAFGPPDVQGGHILLGTDAAFADALASGTGQGQGLPLLLTPRDALDPRVADAFTEFGTTRVTILGGTAAVDSSVEEELTGMGITVDRAAGPSRIHTAVEIAEAFNPDARIAYVMRAFGEGTAGFADALGGSSAVARTRGVALLTDTGRLSDPTREWLVQSQIESIVVVGGTAAISAEVEAELRALATGAGSPHVVRLAGSSRESTAEALATAHPCDLFPCTPEVCETLPGCNPASSCPEGACDFNACPLGVTCDLSSPLAPLVDPLVVDGHAETSWVSAFLYGWTGRPVLLFNPALDDASALRLLASPTVDGDAAWAQTGSGGAGLFNAALSDGRVEMVRSGDLLCVRAALTSTDGTPPADDTITVGALALPVRWVAQPPLDLGDRRVHVFTAEACTKLEPGEPNPANVTLAGEQVALRRVESRVGVAADGVLLEVTGLEDGTTRVFGTVSPESLPGLESIELVRGDRRDTVPVAPTGRISHDIAPEGAGSAGGFDLTLLFAAFGFIAEEDVPFLSDGPRIQSASAPPALGLAACRRD